MNIGTETNCSLEQTLRTSNKNLQLPIDEIVFKIALTFSYDAVTTESP